MGEAKIKIMKNSFGWVPSAVSKSMPAWHVGTEVSEWGMEGLEGGVRQ